MKFSFRIDESIELKEKIIYSESGEFDCFPNMNTDIIVLIQYLNIGFDSQDNSAKQIWGLNHKASWITKRLRTPESRKGKLYVSEDINSGDSKRLSKFGKETYFDPESGWICMGKYQNIGKYDNVEFLKNVIASLGDGELKALWINPNFDNEK